MARASAAAPGTGKGGVAASRVVRVVFIALVLDLLAFTLPLPLFPRLIDYYTTQESSNPHSLLSRSLSLFRYLRALATSSGSGTWSASGNEGGGMTGGNKRWDVVLLGGAIGSVFSLCQCVISPFLGSLSDKYGRKPVLLATMVGNIISALIWLQSTSFASYILSRLVGGLSEGNVQLTTAIISDVTESSTRSKSLAMVGIAFSICFTFGPSLGAYFASRPLPIPNASSTNAFNLNIYAFPALISVILLLAETFYLFIALPETRGWNKKAGAEGQVDGANKAGKQEKVVARESTEVREKRLRALGRLHGLFLLIFSGAEFTLTFLTYDLFFATNKQNGLLLSFIGILSSLLQGGHVRPSLSKSRVTELTFAQRGMFSCCIALGLMAVLPLQSIRESKSLRSWILYAAATGLAYTSATGVTGLMAAAAECCDEEGRGEGSGRLTRGKALGRFRSAGQLGRAIGPLLATATYWTQGPSVTYSIAAVAMTLLGASMSALVREEVRRKKALKRE